MRASLLLLLLVACSDGSKESGDGDTDTDTDADTDSDTDADACTTWLATYDLTGSIFQIDALADFTITVDEPYDDDLKMGPGTMVLRVPDNDGSPAWDSTVHIVEYHLTQNHVTGVTGVAEVTTDLQNDADTKDGCPVASGTSNGVGSLEWDPANMSSYCQSGEISCEGSFCGTGGSPPQGEPVVLDNECGTFPLNNFTWIDGSSFIMPAVTVSETSDQKTTMLFTGEQVSLVQDTNTPSCACIE